MSVPAERLSVLNEREPNPRGSYVLYWMVAARRPGWNFALQRACDWARRLGRPVLVLEAVRIDYRWASDRLHRFVMDGMAENASEFDRRGVAYYPYVEAEAGRGKGLVAALAQSACLVVTDDFPAFFLPGMLHAARRIPVRLEAVDSNGLLPLRAADRVFPTAHGFRRFLQKELPRHLEAMPESDPLEGVPAGMPRLPRGLFERWPALAPGEAGLSRVRELSTLPIDHEVPPAPYVGGFTEGNRQLTSFISGTLPSYGEKRTDPTERIGSGLSPYLHFGHVGSHQVFQAVVRSEAWAASDLANLAAGKRHGWWGMSPGAEAFLDELVTWRELGFNMCALSADYDRFESLPEWARRTLKEHASDRRPHVYHRPQLEAAETHDPIWNAAQRQLVREGRIHSYLRMLWGKKILEWSRTPRAALRLMIELNNRWAVDGRDPNSYNGIFWVLGRYDRPWGPERPIFGKVRYMSSENTARKFNLRRYLDRYDKA